MARFVSIWFRHLNTDWFSLRDPQFRNVPFVLRASSHGRMVITASNAMAEIKGITSGMVLADARAIIPELVAIDDKPDLSERLLKRLAEWCIRFTPTVCVDPPDGLLLDVSGCSHLWGGDEPYVNNIVKKLNKRGYDVSIAMADTIGVAWGTARFGNNQKVISSGCHVEALMNLPPEALRLETDVVARLHKLGLHQIRQFITIPRSSLRRRFGQHFMMRLDMALGKEIVSLTPVVPLLPYQERLPCLEPIVNATGIEIALRKLLEILCARLQQDQKGLRKVIFKGYRVDGKIEQVDIQTNRPGHHVDHLFKLFCEKLSSIEPALGIELFVLEAPIVEEYIPEQVKMWESSDGLNDVRLSELMDRLTNKLGDNVIHRYLPDEHYWPERSFKPAASLQEKSTISWPSNKLRPIHLLKIPERIEVSVLVPDYPPMLFRYKGKVHTIRKADGPERIEQEWWIKQGQHRDYYCVEDDEGHRYWLFRLGHYDRENLQWFIHGFFA